MTQSDLSKRTPEEVFTHHVQALGAEDLDGILMDYTDAPISSIHQVLCAARTRYAVSSPILYNLFLKQSGASGQPM